MPSRDASGDDGAGVRRRRIQGCEMEEHQNKLAPCAKALFIRPSARSASCDARPPARATSQTKQRLDGKARVELSRQIPRLDRCDPRDVLRPSRLTIPQDGIFTSARTEVGQPGRAIKI